MVHGKRTARISVGGGPCSKRIQLEEERTVVQEEVPPTPLSTPTPTENPAQDLPANDDRSVDPEEYDAEEDNWVFRRYSDHQGDDQFHPILMDLLQQVFTNVMVTYECEELIHSEYGSF